LNDQVIKPSGFTLVEGVRERGQKGSCTMFIRQFEKGEENEAGKVLLTKGLQANGGINTPALCYREMLKKGYEVKMEDRREGKA